MNQIFLHYTKWECWKNGLYRDWSKSEEKKMIQKSVALLSSPDRLKDAMMRVTIEWPNSTLVNFTNSSQNRRAWLGQSACCINHGCPEDLTRSAWWKLDLMQKRSANDVAEIVINEWGKKFTRNNVIIQAKQLSLFKQKNQLCQRFI